MDCKEPVTYLLIVVTLLSLFTNVYFVVKIMMLKPFEQPIQPNQVPVAPTRWAPFAKPSGKQKIVVNDDRKAWQIENQ